MGITDKALLKAKELMAKNPHYRNRMLRVYIVGNDLDNLEYGVAFDCVNEGDVIFRLREDLSVVLSQNCSKMLENGMIDYIENESGAGFIIYNANEVRRATRGSRLQH